MAPTNVSPNVIWHVIRKSNSYVQRRNGRTRRTGAVALSGERGNVLNKHSFAQSGLANKDVFGLDEDAKTVTLYVKKSAEVKSPRNEFEEIPLEVDLKEGIVLIKSKSSGLYKRRDLEKALMQRFKLAKRAAMVQDGERSKGVQKKGRN